MTNRREFLKGITASAGLFLTGHPVKTEKQESVVVLLDTSGSMIRHSDKFPDFLSYFRKNVMVIGTTNHGDESPIEILSDVGEPIDIDVVSLIGNYSPLSEALNAVSDMTDKKIFFFTDEYATNPESYNTMLENVKNDVTIVNVEE